MSRKNQVYRDRTTVDPKYKNALVSKLINHIMERGKKSTATKIVYNSFDIVAEKTKKDPLLVFNQAIKNVSPSLEVKGRRIGGANYQIPFEVRGERKIALAMRWIIEVARSGKGKPMANRLATEVIDASRGQGSSIKKKDDVYRMAVANKAFAHYAR